MNETIETMSQTLLFTVNLFIFLYFFISADMLSSRVLSNEWVKILVSKLKTENEEFCL